MAETGTNMHTHVAESKKELEALTGRFGKGYIEAFHDMGALSDRFQSVHSVWISPHEIDLLARTGSHVVYNPTANMLLASGIAPIVKLQAAGVNVALGTDNPNNNNDMLELMKFAGLLQKVGTLEPLAVPATTVLEMATINGAKALHLDQLIGSLEVGKQADIVTVETRNPHNSPLHDPVATLVYSSNGGDVRNVLLAGRQLLKDGNVLHIDEQNLTRHAQACADRLREQLNPDYN
jgi:5-methylthioadenosine/S-adenosylhomocysteine deaminase